MIASTARIVVPSILAFCFLVRGGRVETQNRPLPPRGLTQKRGPTASPESAYANAKLFGAKGNGQADDTTPIQKAIDSFGSFGGPVYFPPGTYRITAPLKARKGSTFLGAGAGARDPIDAETPVSKIDATSLIKGAAIIASPNTAGLRVENLYLQGGRDDIGLDISQFSHRVRLTNLFVLGFSTGIRLRFAKGAILSGVTCDRQSTVGLYIKGSSYVVSSGGAYANASVANVLVEDSQQVHFYDPLVDETTAPGAVSVYFKSGSDCSFNNSAILVGKQATGVQVGDGVTTPVRITLNNLRVTPYASNVQANNIVISRGAGDCRLVNVTTATPNGGGDVVDSGLSTVWLNTNGISRLREKQDRPG